MIVVKFLLLILGFVMLIKGADWFVDGAAGLAKKLKIPEIVIGLTVVAMGTSLPEASVSISSALKNSADLAVGNVVGSNLLNILIILGLTSMICPLAVKKNTCLIEMPFLVLMTVLLFVLGLDGSLNRIDGIIFIVCFCVYLLYLLKSAKNNDEKPEETKDMPVWKLLLALVVGMGIVILGSNITVDSASYIAKAAGVSERMVGLTVVALGTSLPELVTCIIAAKKKSADLAIGNIVGSNIFNILFVLGLTSVITVVPYKVAFLKDALFAILSSVMLLLGSVICKKKITRFMGFLFLVTYGIYFVVIVL